MRISLVLSIIAFIISLCALNQSWKTYSQIQELEEVNTIALTYEDNLVFYDEAYPYMILPNFTKVTP